MRKWFAILLALVLLCTAASADVLVSGDKVNLRSGPGVQFGVLANVRKDTVLRDLGYVGIDRNAAAWRWVEYDGQECWISAQYADLTPAADVLPAEMQAYATLLGRWKMTEHSILGENTEEVGRPILSAGLILSLAYDESGDVCLRSDIQLCDGEYVSRFLMPIECRDIPVSAWREELSGVHATNPQWSARLYYPNDEDYWDFVIDMADTDHLTMYWLLHADEEAMDVLTFARMADDETDDGSSPARWQEMTSEHLLGEWEAVRGRIDTYSYEDAKAEGVLDNLSFHWNEFGEIGVNWNRTDKPDFVSARVIPIATRGLRNAPESQWYADLTRLLEEPGRRTLLYFCDPQTLCLEQLYTIDEMPASDCIVFCKVPD